MTVHPRPTLAVSTPPSAADETPPQDAAAPQVKPKILRRPAQFSSPAAPSHDSATPDLRLNAPPLASQHATTSLPRPWQDDPRFAIALLAIIIIVNVALSLWLSPRSPSSSIADTTRISAAEEPAETSDTTITPSPEETLLFHLGEAGARVSEQ